MSVYRVRPPSAPQPAAEPPAPRPCIRCEEAEPAWGSFFCQACQDKIAAPPPLPAPKKKMGPFHRGAHQ